MTNQTDNEVTQVEVIQADRDAARPLWAGWWRNMKADKIAEFADEGLLDNHELVQAFARHRSQQAAPEVVEAPTGAIENGREFLLRLAQHYQFTDEHGHRLDTCYDYTEAVRCFEHLAERATLTAPPQPSADVVEALRGAIIRASGDDCTTDEAEYYAQTFARCGLSIAFASLPTEAPKVVEAIAKFDDLPSETLLSVHTTEHPVIEAYRLLTVGDLRALAAIRKEPEGTSTQGDGA